MAFPWKPEHADHARLYSQRVSDTEFAWWTISDRLQVDEDGHQPGSKLLNVRYAIYASEEHCE